MRCTGLMSGAVASLLLAAGAEAATITIVPDHLIQGPSQTVQVMVSGTEQVFGLDFFVQIGDGGAGIGGTDVAPVITSVDLISGTIFAANNSGQSDLSVFPLVYAGGISANSGTVLANGLLATITLDTSGVTADSFRLMTQAVAGVFDTQLTDGNGDPIALSQPPFVTIAVPEPTVMLGLSAMGSILLLRPRSGRA